MHYIDALLQKEKDTIPKYVWLILYCNIL